jgi:hypothetical protein
MTQHYPIGTPGEPWQQKEKLQWLASQSVKRSYQEQVLDKLTQVSDVFEQVQYGALPQDPARYPLYAFVVKHIDPLKPTVLISGGVHGYETSGVQGAIEFLLKSAERYTSNFNIIVAPCISPWGYETINRWNADAIDPNRSFYEGSPAQESALIMQFVKSLSTPIFAHFDLHETTDTDDSEFRPALAARDALTFSEWGIPDGFYTVADTPNPQLSFQQAIVSAVEQVTHIAPADSNGNIIGTEVVSHGVICYDKASVHLCAGFTQAPYVTTTEVYPDSPKVTPEQCIDAQVAAITGGLDFLVQQTILEVFR